MCNYICIYKHVYEYIVVIIQIYQGKDLCQYDRN